MGISESVANGMEVNRCKWMNNFLYGETRTQCYLRLCRDFADLIRKNYYNISVDKQRAGVCVAINLHES